MEKEYRYYTVKTKTNKTHIQNRSIFYSENLTDIDQIDTLAHLYMTTPSTQLVQALIDENEQRLTMK
jgi:arginine repressor